MATEVVWVARRRLPTLVGLDASCTVPGSDARPPVRVVFLGDSSLTGPGLRGPEDVWMRQALDRLDHDRPMEITSLAVGGSRVADVAGRVEQALELSPDLLVLAVGANDAIHGTRVTTFASRLDAVLERILVAVPLVAVANLGDLGNVARLPRPLNAAMRARSALICSAIEQVVASHRRAVLLDVTGSNEAFRDRHVFGADLFHPNELGHSIWAEAVLPGLESAFGRLVEHNGATAST